MDVFSSFVVLKFRIESPHCWPLRVDPKHPSCSVCERIVEWGSVQVSVAFSFLFELSSRVVRDFDIHLERFDRYASQRVDTGASPIEVSCDLDSSLHISNMDPLILDKSDEGCAGDSLVECK